MGGVGVGVRLVLSVWSLDYVSLVEPKWHGLLVVINLQVLRKLQQQRWFVGPSVFDLRWEFMYDDIKGR